ncbi:hypothetical protein GFS60_03243 [Rhodococcus sp. WAY2]|nr:hypothetical protein GFS60_03243 [Rhodococcus sp. WAY2]
MTFADQSISPAGGPCRPPGHQTEVESHDADFPNSIGIVNDRWVGRRRAQASR